jgi:hypothetical protein
VIPSEGGLLWVWLSSSSILCSGRSSGAMQSAGTSIWFFIGISLLVNGILIVQAGIREMVHPPANPVVLFHFHANVWWGAVLLVVGVFYCLRFAPKRGVKC